MARIGSNASRAHAHVDRAARRNTPRWGLGKYTKPGSDARENRRCRAFRRALDTWRHLGDLGAALPSGPAVIDVATVSSDGPAQALIDAVADQTADAQPFSPTASWRAVASDPKNACE